MGRPPIGKRAMTDAERKRRQRAKLRDSQPVTKTRLTLDRCFDGLIALLQDEPKSAVQDIFNGFVNRFEAAHKKRRKAGVPCRPITTAEAKADERFRKVGEAIGDIVGDAFGGRRRSNPPQVARPSVGRK